jgi:hypothetical protein
MYRRPFPLRRIFFKPPRSIVGFQDLKRSLGVPKGAIFLAVYFDGISAVVALLLATPHKFEDAFGCGRLRALRPHTRAAMSNLDCPLGAV